MLVDLLVTACADAWTNDGEVLASGIGVVPRLAASLAMERNPRLMMTDSEAFMVSEPVPLGPRNGYKPKTETWMGFSRIFDNVWSGKRHALVGPTQIDRFGQANISAIGDYRKPKIQMLGVRGFPGNSICHANSFFVPKHSKRVFVDGEVDMVASVGYNPQRLPKGYDLDDIDIRIVVTNLCVMDFGGPNKKARLLSLHPNVTVHDVVSNTSFDICVPSKVPITLNPTDDELKIIARLDPSNLRVSAVQ